MKSQNQRLKRGARILCYAALVVLGLVIIGLRLCATHRCDVGAIPVHQLVQTLTMIVGLMGAGLAAWASVRTARTQVVMTKGGSYPKDKHPIIYHLMLVFYVVLTAVLLGASVTAGSLYYSGSY